jgi:predicted amidohydrolase
VLACAATAHVGLVMGLTEFEEESGRYYNTNVATSPDGQVLTVYHKTHTFGPRERALLTQGDSLDTSVFTIDGVRCATFICYDFEFPEAVRCVVLAGAQCLLVSSGNWFGLEYGQRTQRFTRAIENHIFLGYSMRTGSNETHEFHGDAAVVDPYGHLLAVAQREEALLLATIEPTLIEDSRRECDYLSDRRPELYRRILEAPTTSA